MLLPEPDAPVIATSLPSGKLDVHALQIVLARAAHGQRLAVALAALRAASRSTACRRGTARSATPCTRRMSSSVPCTTTSPPWTPGPGPHLDDVVGGANGVLVVLDHDDGVADVAQAFERGDHLHVVLGMQADAGLVEHVQHAHQARADLRRQPDALRFAAGKRARAAVEVQIVEADARAAVPGGRGSRPAPGGPRRRRGPPA